MGGGVVTTTTTTPAATTPPATPATSVTLTAHAKHKDYPHDSAQTVLAVASMQAALSDAVRIGSKQRAPLDVICVIDRSGSMAGQKLDLVKSTTEFVFRQLRPVDRFSLVSYDSNVTCDLAPTEMSPAGVERAKSAVTKLKAGSCTNLSGGLFEGLTQVDKRVNPAAVCSVLLFTDGLANEGIQDKTALKEALTKRMTRTTGATIYTFGFGADHDAEMLQGIAACGNGLYYFIEDTDRIPGAFGDCLGGLQSVVAQNIKLEIVAQPGTTITTVYNGKYAMEGALPSTSMVSLRLGDVFDGESKDIVMQLSIPRLDAPRPAQYEIARFRLTYFDVNEAADCSAEAGLLIVRPPDVPTERPINERVEMQHGRVRAAEAIEESRKLADAGKLTEARSRLTEVQVEMHGFKSAATPMVQMMAAELGNIGAKMASEDVYRQSGRNEMVSREMAYGQQRSNKASKFSSTPRRAAHAVPGSASSSAAPAPPVELEDDDEDVFETEAKKASKKAAFSFAFSK